jgi:hypothetical protein
MDYKYLLIFFVMIGIICITINLTSMYKTCPAQKIVYRYIPRSFEEEQDEPIPPSEIFFDLFNKPSPWVSGFALTKFSKNDINKYFISQNC